MLLLGAAARCSSTHHTPELCTAALNHATGRNVMPFGFEVSALMGAVAKNWMQDASGSTLSMEGGPNHTRPNNHDAMII